MQNPMLSQKAKAIVFASLHRAGKCFVTPNPWDAGSAKILTELGFQALASTGAGLAFSHGMADNTISREMLLVHLRALCEATDLPVSADLEAGFGNDPLSVAQTIRMAAACGIVGGSIEDASRDPRQPLLGHALAAARVKAAAQAARELDFPFTLTARAENFFVGRPDLSDTIARLQAYEEAGADVLFAPGLTRREDIATVVRETGRPLSVMAGIAGMDLGIAELEDLGVTRVSVGASLARSAYGALYAGAGELLAHGRTGYARSAPSGAQLNALFAAGQSANDVRKQEVSHD